MGFKPRSFYMKISKNYFFSRFLMLNAVLINDFRISFDC